MDQLFVTSIALDLGVGVAPGEEAGALLAISGVGTGRPEHRFRLA